VFCAKALAINAPPNPERIDGSIGGLAKIRQTAQNYENNDD